MGSLALPAHSSGSPLAVPTSGGALGGATSLLLMDETGLNPLPAGILVSISDATGMVGQAYTTAGGLLNVSVANLDAVTATFRGTQAPSAPFAFVGNGGNPQTIVILGYRSPTLSGPGSAALQTAKWPRKFGLVAKAAGGNAYAFAAGMAAMLAAIDADTQSVLGSERLQSSVSTAIDSWVNDFLGAGTWGRFASEPDWAYIERVTLWLTSPKPTLYTTALLLNAYLVAQLAYGGVTPGSYGWPTVEVFDIASDATRAYASGCTDFQGDFVVYFNFPGGGGAFQPWSLGNSFLGVSTFLGGSSTSSYTPGTDIIALVNTLKMPGTLPLYTANIS
jgi:hypothetical protein